MASKLQIITYLALAFTFFSLVENLLLAAAEEDYDDDDDMPVPKLSTNVGMPTLKFFYCYSCGYRKAFEEYANILAVKYPEIVVDGKNYDPPGMNMFFVRVLGILKSVVIICIIGSVNVFTYINLPQPTWWTWCLENKIYACLMCFFLTNLVEGQLVQSGAFEITLNDIPVWSKLETGRIPQPNELFQIIDSHMKLPDNIFDYEKNKIM